MQTECNRRPFVATGVLTEGRLSNKASFLVFNGSNLSLVLREMQMWEVHIWRLQWWFGLLRTDRASVSGWTEECSKLDEIVIETCRQRLQVKCLWGKCEKEQNYRQLEQPCSLLTIRPSNPKGLLLLLQVGVVFLETRRSSPAYNVVEKIASLYNDKTKRKKSPFRSFAGMFVVSVKVGDDNNPEYGYCSISSNLVT